MLFIYEADFLMISIFQFLPVSLTETVGWLIKNTWLQRGGESVAAVLSS